MADQQPVGESGRVEPSNFGAQPNNVPSATPSVEEPQVSHEQGEERPSSSWFDTLRARVLGVGRTAEPEASQAGDQEQATSETQQASSQTPESAEQTQTAAGEETPAQPYAVIEGRTFQTQEDWRRYEQSLKDQHVANLNRQAKEQERRAREARLRELRDTDVQEFAEEHRKLDEENQREQMTEANQEYVVQLLDGVRKGFDENVVIPLASRISRDDQERIYASAPAGIEGRRYIVEQITEALIRDAEARGEQRARQKLRSDRVFLKEVQAGLRDERDEPDLAPASPVFAQSDDMSTRLRKAAGLL